MTITTKHLFGLALIALIALLALEMQVPTKSQAAPSWISNITTTATTSATFSVTTSSRILSTTTNPTGTPGVTSNIRVYATICTNGANPVALNLNGDKDANVVTGRVTTFIAAAAGYNACYEITDVNLYQGSVKASSTNETASQVFVQEFVQ